jgi:hypothetical protein
VVPTVVGAVSQSRRELASPTRSPTVRCHRSEEERRKPTGPQHRGQHRGDREIKPVVVHRVTSFPYLSVAFTTSPYRGTITRPLREALREKFLSGSEKFRELSEGSEGYEELSLDAKMNFSLPSFPRWLPVTSLIQAAYPVAVSWPLAGILRKYLLIP